MNVLGAAEVPIGQVGTSSNGSLAKVEFLHRMEPHAGVHEPSPAFIGYQRKVQYHSFVVACWRQDTNQGKIWVEYIHTMMSLGTNIYSVIGTYPITR